MSDVQRWTSNSVAPSDAGGFVAYGDYKELRAEVIRQQARSVRMVGLMRKLREPDWHIESIREFQREMTALENAVMSDDTILREMIEAARVEEREAIIAKLLEIGALGDGDFIAAIRARSAK